MDAAVTAAAPETQAPAVSPVAETYRPMLPPPLATAPRVKSPGIALFLSLFPGLGQIYNGQIQKAMTFFAVWATGVWLTAETGPPFALLLPFIYFYNLIDAWQSANRINLRAAGGQETDVTDDGDSPIWGATLVGIGLVILLRNLGWISFEWFQRWWPLILVGIGVSFVLRSMQRRGDVQN